MIGTPFGVLVSATDFGDNHELDVLIAEKVPGGSEGVSGAV
jgi:hypothetical protein